MNLRNKSDVEKSKLIIERADNRNLFYKKILKLWAVCSGMNIRLIMENPYSTFHFLKNNFPCKPSVIDMNRMERGDYFVKPTQYWFVNCKPTYGYTYQNDKDKKTLNQISGNQVGGICNTERSMISPDYARNWICEFVIGKTQNIGQLQFDFS